MGIPLFQKGSRQVKATVRQKWQTSAQAALNAALTTSLWWLRSSLADVIYSSPIPTSIQYIIFPSRDTANTCFFWLIPLNRYMALYNALPPSSRVTRSPANYARNSTSSRHSKQTSTFRVHGLLVFDEGRRGY